MTHPIQSIATPTPRFPATPPPDEAVAYVTVNGVTFTVRPGEPAPQLLALQRSLQVRQWAILSAANPHGLSIASGENQRRHELLRAATAAENLPVIEVEICWQSYGPKLQALWIGGIPLHQAQELARDFVQTKLFFGDVERVPSIQTCGALTFEI